MTGGIRAELRIDGPESCPVAGVAREGSARSISKSADARSGRVTEEFLLDGPVDADADLEPVFDYGSATVYRFDREADRGCPCECVESFGCPIADAYTTDGTLHLAFHAPDMDRLRAVVTDARERYESVEIERLVRSQAEGDGDDLVFVDRSTLTERQRECLETAHEMGYFEHPKSANAGDVADRLGITTSTFTEHLAAAQGKLLADVLEEG
jgi:predicted DNA binding protein